MKLDKLTIATTFAFALCLGSLAARSHALRARPALPESTARLQFQGQAEAEQAVSVAIDGHLRLNLRRLAAR